jgi:hypothetical protein
MLKISGSNQSGNIVLGLINFNKNIVSSKHIFTKQTDFALALANQNSRDGSLETQPSPHFDTRRKRSEPIASR